MKIFLFAATLGGYNALPLEGDELKARVNFDYWARTSKTEHNIDQSNVPVKPSIGVSHGELPFVVYRLLKKSNVWASGHLLALAQERFDHQSYDMEIETLMLMTDLLEISRRTTLNAYARLRDDLILKPNRIQRILNRLDTLADKGDELAELINAWRFASGPIKIKSAYAISNLNSQITETGANRLRGIRADLLTLLASVPDDKIVATPTQNSDDSGNSQYYYSGDGSGDYLVDDVITTEDLVYNPAGESAYADLTNPSDQLNLAQLVRNGLIDDDSIFVNGQQDDLGEEIIPSGSFSKDLSDSSTNQNQERAFGLFDKVDNDESSSSSAVLTADWSANQMPVFEKYQANRNPRLINGQNSNADSSSWLGYSLLGSIGAILVTVSATVCVRRLNSKKAQNSGTPIQKLKRESIGNQSRPNLGLSGSRPFHGSQVNFGQGYNPAMRPQFFNPNQPIGGQGFSSAMSVHSGATSGWGPNQNPVSNHGSSHSHSRGHGPTGLIGHSGPPSLPRTGPVTSKTHSLSSGYGSHMPLHGGHMPSRGGHMANMPYPNQNRALPPPPYAKIQY